MNISKKVPVIVSIVISLFCVLCAYISVDSRYYLSDDRQFLYTVTLKEDVRIFDTELAIDTVLDGKQYEHSVIPAGSKGQINVPYGHYSTCFNDPETNTHSIRVEFYQNDEIIHAHFTTGPESQLQDGDIYYKSFENPEELIADYDQKVKEAKDDWNKQNRLRILRYIAIEVIFSIIFTIICVAANKLKMPSAVFGIFCFLYVLLLLTIAIFNLFWI